MSDYTQLQFRFMRNIILQCYVRAEVKFMRATYKTYFQPKGISHGEYMYQIYIPRFAQKWQDENKDRYFKGIDDIL